MATQCQQVFCSLCLEARGVEAQPGGLEMKEGRSVLEHSGVGGEVDGRGDGMGESVLERGCGGGVVASGNFEVADQLCVVDHSAAQVADRESVPRHSAEGVDFPSVNEHFVVVEPMTILIELNDFIEPVRCN